MNSTTASTLRTEIKPLDPTIVREYIGFFIFKNKRTEPKFKVFDFKGLLNGAVNEFRNHCEVMGYRFISVRPHKVNLKEQEERKLANPDFDEESTDI